MAVPFNDLNLQHKSIESEITLAINEVIRGSSFVRGPHVVKFENEFAALAEQDYCISCGNGTDALELTLSALELAPNDEVITTAHSWISSASAITRSGAKVVFCDTASEHCNVDPDLIEEKITKNTKGILVVHLFGCPAEMDKITAIAKKHNLWIVEDCAQAHIASYKGTQVGKFGIAATFSFYPGKNLGAMGDAGAVVTNNRELSDKIQRLARHGGIFKGEHLFEARNSRMDGLQGAILSVKMRHLKKWTKKRQELASRYITRLDNISSILLPKYEYHMNSVFHLFVIKTNQRDELRQHLNKRSIQTVINYPEALPFLPAYKHLNHQAEDFPNAFKRQSEILSLPLYPEMSFDQQDEVIEAIFSYFEPEKGDFDK